MPITLDGTLDDEAWTLADSTRDVFYQSIPNQGMPSAERTVVRVLYDDVRLYIGAIMYDSNPGALVSAGLEQDFATQDSDIFGFALDTYLDRQNAFLFAVNPAGALFDAQAFNDQQSVNRAWEGEVDVTTSITEFGWVAEVAVPLTTLRFRQADGPQSWGLNFARRVRRISEDSQWAPLTRQFRVYKMSRAGTLTSLDGLQQGRNVWVKPFLNGVRTDGQRANSPGEKLEGGFDLKWGITPQLTLDVTALTDFSQVEVDEQQINLTRFSLFFPEKRDFFLENDGIFSFQDNRVRNFRLGSGPQNFKLFHSRRIGLSAARTPVPIAGGARLTGRVGGYAIGLLNMQTRDDPAHPGENFSVVRLRKNILGSSDIGFMFINREGTGGSAADAYNRTLGADANLRLAGGRMLLNSYLAVTDEPDATGDRTTGAVEVAWRDPVWDASALVKTVGEDFNPGTGFVARRGVRQGFVTVGAHPQPAIPHVRELNPYVNVNLFSDPGWALESREIKPGLGVAFLDSGILTMEYSASYERLAEATPIAGGLGSRGRVRLRCLHDQLPVESGTKAGRQDLRHPGRLLRRRPDVGDRQRDAAPQRTPLRRGYRPAQPPDARRPRLRREPLRRARQVCLRHTHLPERVRAVQRVLRPAADQHPLQPDPRAPERCLPGLLGTARPAPRAGRRGTGRPRDHVEGDEAAGVLRSALPAPAARLSGPAALGAPATLVVTRRFTMGS